MAKQDKSYEDNPTFELFDEVELNPDMFPESDISNGESYCVIKKYIVELGEYKVPYVDIRRQDEPDEVSLRGIEVASRWTKPFILSLPCETIRFTKSTHCRVNKDNEHASQR